MLAYENIDLSNIPRRSEAIRLSGYSGFVPNEALIQLRNFEIVVYGVVQFLAFFNRKVNANEITKITHGSKSSTANALASLKSKGFILKTEDGYRFKNHKPGNSQEFLTCRELSRSHLGYYIPLSIISDPRINYVDKIIFTIVKSLLNGNKECKISVGFIARKLARSRYTISASLSRLCKIYYLKRKKGRAFGLFTYSIGGLGMSKLPTGNGAENEQCHQVATPKCHQDATYSINKNNIYYKHTRIDKRESDTYEIRQNKSLFFLDEVIDYVFDEKDKLELEEKRAIDTEQRLQNEYTEACTQRDVSKMQEMAPRLAHSERKRQACGDSYSNIKKAFRRHDYALGKMSYLRLNNHQIEKIGKTLKDTLPEFPAKSIRKAAFNLLMNSVICDLKAEFEKTLKQTDWRISNREQIAMDNAISNCLRRVVLSNDYRLNAEVDFGFYSKSVNKKQQKEYAPHWMN